MTEGVGGGIYIYIVFFLPDFSDDMFAIVGTGSLKLESGPPDCWRRSLSVSVRDGAAAVAAAARKWRDEDSVCWGGGWLGGSLKGPRQGWGRASEVSPRKTRFLSASGPPLSSSHPGSQAPSLAPLELSWKPGGKTRQGGWD